MPPTSSKTGHIAVKVGSCPSGGYRRRRLRVIGAGKAKIVNTMADKGVVTDEIYDVVGTLVDKRSGEPFLDKDGNEG